MAQPILFFITEDYQLASYAEDGTVSIHSGQGKGTDVTFSKDGTVWVLTLDPMPKGGNNIDYWIPGGTQFMNGGDVPSSPGPIAICPGFVEDTVTYLRTDEYVGVFGKKSSIPEVEQSWRFKDISVDPTEGGLFWGISELVDSQHDGYRLAYSKDLNNNSDFHFMKLEKDPKQICAYNGNCYLVDDRNAILAVTAAGGHGTYSDEGFALEVEAGATGIYCVSLEITSINHTNYKFGNVVKKWTSGGTWEPLPVKGQDQLLTAKAIAVPI